MSRVLDALNGKGVPAVSHDDLVQTGYREHVAALVLPQLVQAGFPPVQAARHALDYADALIAALALPELVRPPAAETLTAPEDEVFPDNIGVPYREDIGGS